MLKVYFQPGTDVGASIAQINAVSRPSSTLCRPACRRPASSSINAANVPVVQMTISSKTLPEQQLADYALNFIRIKLFTIPGLSSPAPFGGKTRADHDLCRPGQAQRQGTYRPARC